VIGYRFLLPHLPIASPVTNGHVLLSQVASIEARPGTPQITRENQRQMVAVTASLSGRDLGSTTSDIQGRIARQLQLPAGYTVEYGGLYASQQQSFQQLALVLVTASLFVFSLLAAPVLLMALELVKPPRPAAPETDMDEREPEELAEKQSLPPRWRAPAG
jgi:Cu/Ag efflux pump CusA